MDINKFKVNSKFLNSEEKQVNDIKQIEKTIKQLIIEEFESMGYKLTKS